MIAHWTYMVRSLILVALLACSASLAPAQDFPISNVLIPGEKWQLVSEGHQFTEGPAADADGNVYFVDVPTSKIFHIEHASGKAKLITDKAEKTSGLAIGPDGTLYGVQGATKRVVKYDAAGKATTIAEGIDVNDLAVGPDGGIYVTDFPNHAVWYVSPKGEKRIADKIDKPNGLTFWPDGKTLVVGDFGGNYLYSFRVEGDGSLAHKEGNYSPQLVNGKVGSGADGIETDSEGRLYVATYAGLQVFDRECRLSGVIAKPQEKFLSNVCFGGPKFDTLYVTCQDKVYRRVVKTHGLSPVKK